MLNRLYGWLKQLKRIIGRRGSYLIAKGLVVVFYGVALLPAHALPVSAQATLKIALSIASLHVWGFIWIALGLVALISAFFSKHDRWGFLALIIITSFWAINYLLAWLFFPASRIARPWLGTLWFAGLSAATLVTSGWSEN